MILKNSNLLLLAFASVFLSRTIHALGFPALIDFFHLAFVPFASVFTLLTNRTSKHCYSLIISPSLFSLYLLLVVMVASALINEAGIVNIVFEFVLFAEPVLLMLAIISLPRIANNIEKFRAWIFRFALADIVFSHIQRFVFRFDLHNTDINDPYDDIKGIFIGQGAGHYVGAAVSLTFGFYYFVTTVGTRPRWARIAILLAAISRVIISGRRQTFFAFVFALVILTLINTKNFKRMLIYLSAIALAIALLIVAAFTVLKSLQLGNFIRPDVVAGVIDLKTCPFRIVVAHYESPLNILFGVGPGHSVDRLGGWMLQPWGYWNMLHPLGATRSVISDEVWGEVGSNWVGPLSTFFSPFFGWAAIWGDLGFLGLGVYFYLSFLLWRYVCLDQISKFFLLTIFVFGLIFTWLEEPAYMVFLAVLLGLHWHDVMEEKEARKA